MEYNTSMRSLVEFNLDSIEGILISAVSILAIVLLIAVVVLFLLLRHSERKYKEQVDDCSNTLRIFVVDVKNDRVNYFNSSYLRKRKTSSITSFYNQFQSQEREKLIAWVGELLDNNEQTQKFLEIRVYIKSKKMNVPSILEVQKIDLRKQIIYLESHLLKYTAKVHKKGEHHTMVAKDVFTRHVLTSNGKGCTFCVNFFNKSTKTNDFSRLAYVDLKNILSSFVSKDIIMTEHDFGKIIITNLVAINKIDQFSFIDSLKSRINKFLLIESFAEEIDYTIGVLENQVNFRDVNNLIKNVLALSEVAKDDSQQVMFYGDKKNIAVEDEGQKYKTDVETIIQDNKLNYLFQPIVDFSRKRVIGYLNQAVPQDSYFKNIDDLKLYALRTEDDKELFSTIVKNAISRFVEEKNEESVQLFLPISYNEMNYVNRSLGHTSGVNDANIVLVLKEKELNTIPADYGEEGFINSVRSFKSKGYSVALEIDDDVLTLSPKLYSLFDYFILSVASHITKKNAGSQLPSFQGLIEKLLHYQTPIVAMNIPSWDIVELVYKLGVNIICSDAVALPEQNIMPLQKKILTKIRNLKS